MRSRWPYIWSIHTHIHNQHQHCQYSEFCFIEAAFALIIWYEDKFVWTQTLSPQMSSATGKCDLFFVLDIGKYLISLCCFVVFLTKMSDWFLHPGAHWLTAGKHLLRWLWVVGKWQKWILYDETDCRRKVWYVWHIVFFLQEFVLLWAEHYSHMVPYKKMWANLMYNRVLGPL